MTVKNKTSILHNRLLIPVVLTWIIFMIGANTILAKGSDVDTLVPTVPINLNSSGVGAAAFTLNWTAAKDNFGVSGYEVFSNGTSIGTTASTSMGVSGLTCNTTYLMTVRARDTAGNWSAQSSGLSVTTTACGTGGLNVPAGWVQTFSEDFNGTSLNTALWVPGLPYSGTDHLNDEQEHYKASNILISNGICTLQATKNANGTIYSGCITSKTGYKYGYTEARIQLPKGKGYWPAYWMTSSDGRWPPEWDIFEVVDINNNIYGFPHPLSVGLCNFVEGMAGSDCMYSLGEGAPNIYDQYVTYGFTHTATDSYWYVNGILTEHFSTNAAAGSNDHFWILLNLAVGGNWPGAPDGSTPWPGNMNIDYVRLWQPEVISSNINGENISDIEAIYPNPASTEFEISVSNDFIGGHVTLSTLNGEKLIEKKITKITEIINVSNIPNGIYIIGIKNDKKVINRKLVIRK